MVIYFRSTQQLLRKIQALCEEHPTCQLSLQEAWEALWWLVAKEHSPKSPKVKDILHSMNLHFKICSSLSGGQNQQKIHCLKKIVKINENPQPASGKDPGCIISVVHVPSATAAPSLLD